MTELNQSLLIFLVTFIASWNVVGTALVLTALKKISSQLDADGVWIEIIGKAHSDKPGK